MYSGHSMYSGYSKLSTHSAKHQPSEVQQLARPARPARTHLLCRVMSKTIVPALAPAVLGCDSSVSGMALSRMLGVAARTQQNIMDGKL